MNATYGRTPSTVHVTTSTSNVIRVPVSHPFTGADAVGLGLWGASLCVVASIVLRVRGRAR